MQTLEEARFITASVGLHKGNQTSVRIGLKWAGKPSDHVVDKEKRGGQRA